MERAGHRKSKSASRIDGLTQILKNKAYSRLSTDSHTYVDGSSRDIMPFVLELGQSSSRQMNEKPIKKVVTQEMSKEVYSKRRAPSIIAKLMGLEGMPSPRNVQKQQNRLSESYQPKNVSRTNINGSSMEQLEFKDVFEDLEASHIVNRRCSSRSSSASMLAKTEMVQIQRKLMDAKRISSEIFRSSKELGDTFGMLNSNKPLSLKFERIQNSSFANDLQDLNVQPPCSLRSHLTAMKPLAQAKYGGNAKGLASDREISTKHDAGSHQKREDGLLLDPHNRHRSHFSPNSSKTQLEDKSEQKILPTRIVVLKPNLGKAQSAGTPISSADHSYDYVPILSNMKKHSNFGGKETVSCRNELSRYNDELMKSKSNEAREKAQEITRRMKDGCDGTIALMSSGFRGYAGDESSYDDFQSDSDSESEVFKLLSGNSLDNNCRYPSYNFVGSLVDWDAKKRLSERWKMSHRYQDAQIACGEGTLSDLLAKRDRETRPKHLNTKKGFGRASSDLANNNGTSTGDGPLHVERSSDCKDKTNKTFVRAKSLPPSIDSRKRYHLHDDKKLIQGDILHDQKNLVRSGPNCSRRSKVVKENLSRKEDHLSKYLKSKGRKHVSCHYRSVDSSTAHLRIQVEANIEEPSKQPPMLQTASNDETYTTPRSDLMKIAECENVILAQKPSELPPKLEPAVGGTACFDKEDSIFQEIPQALPKANSPSLQCLGMELDSSESSKETDHFSPVSVLEIPFTEDMTSTTESFERVGAELRELRKQLQLLKMESGTFIEEEVVQQYPTVSENNCAFGVNGWDAAYVLDMLVTSGLEESGIDMFTWYAPECPVDPVLFNNLENKYGNDRTVPKHERKMLFDRVNSELSHIFKQHIDRCPWVMPKMAGMDANAQEEKIRNAFEKLVWLEFAYEENADEEMGCWIHSKIEVDKIGKDIGNMLVDEMIIEITL